MLSYLPSRVPTRSLHRMPLLALAVTLAFMLLGRGARAEFKLTIDLKDGDKIHDISKIVAHADSSDGIDKVEFFVDDQLKATATGIPYTLTWDTITDKEGKHQLSITAYDANGQTKKLSVSLEIDNELALGADALAKKAQTALAANDTDMAAAYARRSLKADPSSLNGCRVTAALAAKDSDWAKAVAALEKGAGYDTDPEAMKEMAAYKMRFALRAENAASLVSSIQSVAELRLKSAEMVIDRAKAKDPSNHEAIGDALMNAGHYKAAQIEYQKAGDAMPISTANRVALAYAMQDNIELAVAFVRPLIQEKRADRVTRAVYGLTLLRKQKFAEARSEVAADAAAGYPAALVIAAYSDIVEGKVVQAVAEADAAVKLAPMAGDAGYVKSMVIKNLDESEAELVKVLSLSPFQAGPYVDYAARIALQKQSDRVEDSIKLVDFVLSREPENVGAKLVKVLLLISKNRDAEAEPILDYVTRHNTSPDVQMVAAVFLTHKNKVGQAQQYWDAARKQDTTHFEFLVVPTALQFLQNTERKVHYRAGFFLTFDTLYPPKQVEKAEAPAADGN